MTPPQILPLAGEEVILLRGHESNVGLKVMLYHYSFHYQNVCGLDYTISFL